MPFAFEKLTGLDRDAVMSAIEPVLERCAVSGVELIWKTDQRGWVLHVTIERSDAERSEATQPGAGLSLDECADVSRALSAALDEADVIAPAYRLEVGTPGLERALYSLEDYKRFCDQLVLLRLRTPVDGVSVVRGRLLEVSDDEILIVDTDHGEIEAAYTAILTGRLVLDMSAGQRAPKRRSSARRKPAAMTAPGTNEKPNDGR